MSPMLHHGVAWLAHGAPALLLVLLTGLVVLAAFA